MEKLDAPLRLVQQPVLPEIDRVHAEHQRHQRQQVVRRLPRPRSLLQRPFRASRSKIRSIRPKRRTGSDVCRATPSRVSTARWGTADFTIEYPPLHDLASSRNKYIRAMDYFLTYLDPEPHRKTFMKPFMRLDSAEYCSTCHKVHLDVPVNNYRWIRGFNDYDNWQASGVSGQGARSFYYPPKTSTCSQCHMPRSQVKRSRKSQRDDPLAPLRGRKHGRSIR